MRSLGDKSDCRIERSAKVVHCKRAKYDVYIGRPSKWGNPFAIGKDGSREEVIRKYKNYVLANRDLLKALSELKGKVLGCWCKPKACHGDVLVRLVNSLEVNNVGDEAEYQIEQMMDGRASCGQVHSRRMPSPKEDFSTVVVNKRIAQITFSGNNEVKYDFFTDLNLQVGDTVVCDTVRGYSVGKVAGLLESSTKARAWVVQKVDVEGHRKRTEREWLAKELEEMLG